MPHIRALLRYKIRWKRQFVELTYTIPWTCAERNIRIWWQFWNIFESIWIKFVWIFEYIWISIYTLYEDKNFYASWNNFSFWNREKSKYRSFNWLLLPSYFISVSHSLLMNGTGGYNLKVSFMILSKYFIFCRSV